MVTYNHTIFPSFKENILAMLDWRIILFFTGSSTMALLEKLEPGNVYLVKISASNQAGDGPFSITVELPVLRGKTHTGKNPRHTYSQTKTIGTVVLYVN